MIKLTAAGARWISGFEGCVLYPYNDADNNASIGIGHLIHYGPVTTADETRYHGFTYQDALNLLEQDIRRTEDQIRPLIHTQPTANQWTAMVDIAYNCGPQPIAETAELINAGDWQAATNHWQAWCHGNGGVILAGLVRRRKAEQQLALQIDPSHAWEQQLTHLATTLPAQLKTTTIQRDLAHLRKAVHKRVTAA